MARFPFSRQIAALGLGVLASLALAGDEIAVKAAYLYNFAKFIQWPDEERATLRLCVTGEDNFGNSLDSLIGKPVRHMQLAVRRGVSLQEIPQCDLIFVPAGYEQSLLRVRQVVNSYPILIVTESTSTLPKGAMIALIQADNRIVFEVDLSTTRLFGFQVSAKMLQLARKVY